MATQIPVPLKSLLNSLDKIMHITNFRFVKSSWDLFSTFFFNLFELIINHLFRSNINSDDGKSYSDSNAFCHEYEEKNLDHGSTSLNSYGCREKESSEFYFGFKFQLGDDFLKKNEETESSVLLENDTNMSTSKYAFESAKDIGVFMEEPKVGNFIVQELFMGSNDELIDNQENLDFKDFREPVIIQEGFNELKEGSEFHSKGSDGCMEFSKIGILENFEKTEDSVFSEEKVLEEKEELNLGKNEVSKKEKDNWLADYFLNSESFSYGLEFLSENEFSSFDSNLESDDSGYGFSNSSGEVDSGDCDFLKEVNEDEDKEIESHIENSFEEIKVGFIEEVSDAEEIDDGDKDKPSMADSSELVKENPVLEEDVMEKAKNMWDIDMDEEDEDDVLLEHQSLVEQMKMELRKSRAHGLPTILEECETTRVAEDLKPLQIDEKIEHGDRMGEIQKFYKSYAERMRKLDVLNYQTSQAISFLQMKNPCQLNTCENSSISAITSHLLSNIWPGKSRRIYADPTLKSIGELQRDLESVYVGQVCLSWEILRWQYGKAKEFQEYDSQGIHSYNQVAGEFQQFQVLMQRFTEDEAFQGPRVQNYAKTRSVLRTLLQVPTIKDDLKDKKGKQQDKEYLISMASLAELIEVSMRVFWIFLRADKDCTNFISKTLQDPADLELLADIKTSLQKKEKRIKDIVRTGNCLVKKFQKNQGARLDLSQLISQVELKLVLRVLNMQRLNHDQLIWCRTKLNTITFVDRTKIQIEPIFLLFPC